MIGSAASGREAIQMATKLRPDVVLMDINMPDMDGIAATEQLSTSAPGTAVVMMSVQGEADYLRRSMLAGAREFLVKPFSSDELTASIRQVSSREREKASRIGVATPISTNGTGPGDDEGGQVVAVFSPKGGVGRTTVAVNLAVAAATELGKRVVIMDGSFQFGDVGVLLNLNPKSNSIADLDPRPRGRARSTRSTRSCIDHTSGVRVLLAPPSPEMAEMITPAGVKQVLEVLRHNHDLVVVDCTAFFNDTTLAILDAADVILTMLSLEITSIKNMRLFLEVAEQLGYESGQGPAGPQPRRFDAWHPGGGRRALHRPQGRRDDRQRRPKRRLRPQSWVSRSSSPIGRRRCRRTSFASPAPSSAAGRCSSGPRRHRPGQAQPEEVPIRMAMNVVHSGPDGARRGVIHVPVEADRERSTRIHGAGARRAGRAGSNLPAVPGGPPGIPTSPQARPARRRSGSRSGTSSSGSRTGSSRTWTPSSTCPTRSRSGARSRRSSARSSTRKASP